MTTDYSTALSGLTALVLLFIGMVVFALSRPSDLPQHSQYGTDALHAGRWQALAAPLLLTLDQTNDQEGSEPLLQVLSLCRDKPGRPRKIVDGAVYLAMANRRVPRCRGFGCVIPRSKTTAAVVRTSERPIGTGTAWNASLVLPMRDLLLDSCLVPSTVSRNVTSGLAAVSSP